MGLIWADEVNEEWDDEDCTSSGSPWWWELRDKNEGRVSRGEPGYRPGWLCKVRFWP
jgi:hypothetical protein